MNCPGCDSTRTALYRNYGITSPIGLEEFDLWQCDQCLLVFTVPPPPGDLLAKLYSNDQYYSYQKTMVPSVNAGSGWKGKLKKWAKAKVIDHYYGYGWRQDDFRPKAISSMAGFVMRRWPKEDYSLYKRQ